MRIVIGVALVDLLGSYHRSTGYNAHTIMCIVSDALTGEKDPIT